MNQLVLNNISKNYRKHKALSDITFCIPPGIYGLLGPNGAGKTTLMRILATLISPTSGNITYGDITWNNTNEVRKVIGYLPQKFSFYKNVTIRDALTHISLLKNNNIDHKNEVLRVVEKVNLTKEIDKKIGELSGGMVRRLGIAQALLGSPKILIVDEPTSGLDPEERIRFRNLICSLDKDTIVILSTHIVGDIESTCSKVAILNKGNLLANSSLNELNQYGHGKVWETIVSEKEFNNISPITEIVSTMRLEDKFKLKILSNSPIKDAISVQPTLEDSYLCILKGI